MNLFTGEAADALFGGDAPPAVQALLQEARTASPEQIPSLLWTAQACAPHCLSIYYLLYKCHAGRRQFELAERAARTGLAEAARQAGLPQDWRTAQAGPDFHGTGPARFWLFTLKALAFIALRRGRPDEARALLAQITALAPDAHIGDDVIATMLASVDPADDGP